MSEKLVTVKGQVSQSEREALEDLAAEEKRSISQTVRFAILAYLKAKAA